MTNNDPTEQEIYEWQFNYLSFEKTRHLERRAHNIASQYAEGEAWAQFDRIEYQAIQDILARRYNGEELQ